MKITKSEVVKNIGILKEAGFFKKYGGITDSEIYEGIYEYRKKKYSEIFEKPYDPGMEIDIITLAQTDNSKVIRLKFRKNGKLKLDR